MDKLIPSLFRSRIAFVVWVAAFLYGLPGMFDNGAVWWGLTGEGLPYLPYVIAAGGVVGIVTGLAVYVREQGSRARRLDDLSYLYSELKAAIDTHGGDLGQAGFAPQASSTTMRPLPTDGQALDLWMEHEDVPAEMRPELRRRATQYQHEIAARPRFSRLEREFITEPAPLTTLIRRGEELRNGELQRQASDPFKERFQPMHMLTEQMTRLSQQLSGPVEINNWLMSVAEYVERDFPSFKAEIVQKGLGGKWTGPEVIAALDRDMDVLTKIRGLLRQ